MVDARDIFPLLKVEKDCMVSMQGDITVAFRLQLPEIFTLSDLDYEAYHQAWVRSLRLLPRHSVFHKMDLYFEDGYRADFDSCGNSFLSRASERFFNERPFLDHECLVFLTKKPAGRKLSTSATSNLLRSSIVPQQVVDMAMASEFLDSVGAFAHVLGDSGFVQLSRLSDEDLAGTANTAGIIERYCFLLPKDSQPMIRDVGFGGGISIGDQQMELYTLADAEQLPGYCGSRINYEPYSSERSKFSVGFGSALGGLLCCNHVLNQYVFIGDERDTLKKLEAKKLRMQSLSAYSRENSAGREAVNDFLNEAVVNQRLPVKAHFNVMVFSQHGSRSHELRNLVSSAMAGMDAVAKQETDGAPQLWYAGIPGNAASFPMNETFDTFLEQACCFFNMESSDRSSPSPFGMRLGDRLTGRPLHVDLSDLPMLLGQITNRNKFILGPSGSGKSFFTNHLVRSYYEQGAHLLLVDVGHSYKGLCELVGGYYFSYSEQEPIRFNPFYLTVGDVLDTEKKESIKNLLLALWKKGDEPFRRSEYVALSGALSGYYEHLALHQDLFPCFNTFYEYLLAEYDGILSEAGVREKEFDLSNFLYVLGPYYRGGEFDYLLNASENLDLLHQRMIVFELDAVKDHPILFPAITLIIMEVFISKMRKLKGVRKVILLEEAWKAIAKEGMAESMQYLVKTVRKFFGETIIVTQEVEDIISSPIVKQAILNNSDCKILLDQRKYQNKFDAIQELLGLTDKEKALVLSMNRANDPQLRYKEVFISLGGQYSKVYRTEVSTSEYLAYTTEEREKIRVQEYAQRFGSMQKGIEMLAREIDKR